MFRQILVLAEFVDGDDRRLDLLLSMTGLLLFMLPIGVLRLAQGRLVPALFLQLVLICIWGTVLRALLRRKAHTERQKLWGVAKLALIVASWALMMYASNAACIAMSLACGEAMEADLLSAFLGGV